MFAGGIAQWSPTMKECSGATFPPSLPAQSTVVRTQFILSPPWAITPSISTLMSLVNNQYIIIDVPTE